MGDREKIIELTTVKKGVQKAFSKVKEEFDEHLDSINENTTEINFLQDQINELNEKVDNMSIKMDEVLMALGTRNPYEKKFEKEIILSLREQELFMSLYISEQGLRYVDIARKLGLTDYLVQDHITNLISKGIPIIKQMKDNEVFVSLDVEFKALQAKKNVLKIDDSISKQLMKEQFV